MTDETGKQWISRSFIEKILFAMLAAIVSGIISLFRMWETQQKIITQLALFDQKIGTLSDFNERSREDFYKLKIDFYRFYFSHGGERVTGENSEKIYGRSYGRRGPIGSDNIMLGGFQKN